MSHRIERFGLLLHDAARAFRRRFEEATVGYGLSATQWRVLGLILREGPMQQGQLAERLDVEPISVSRLVDRMERAGWVRRCADPKDRRARIVIASDHALETVAQVKHVAEDLTETVLVDFSDAERQVIHRFLTSLAHAPRGQAHPSQADTSPLDHQTAK
jgi:DNA-binding MarR family transcriptional regulator